MCFDATIICLVPEAMATNIGRQNIYYRTSGIYVFGYKHIYLASILNGPICKAGYNFQSIWTARKSRQIGNQIQAAESIKIKLRKLM